MPHPIVKVIADQGCRSYLIGCPETQEAWLVDPKVGREATYAKYLEAYGLTLKACVDTHTHADHLSASPRFGVPTLMGAKSPVDRELRKVADGERARLGSLSFDVLEVPGHTPDSIALYWAPHSTDQAGMVLTGDSLFIGALARADFRGSDPEQLRASVRTRLLALPDQTVVYPGHEYGDFLFTTIGFEGQHNAALNEPLGEWQEGAGNTPAVDRTLETNLQRSPDLPETAPAAAACCAAAPGPSQADPIEELLGPDVRQAHAHLKDAADWVDVRDPFEYEHGHIPNVTNLPLGELGFHLPHFNARDRVYLSCRSGVRSMTAARTLQRLEAKARPINIGGGILGWQDRGAAIVGLPSV